MDIIRRKKYIVVIAITVILMLVIIGISVLKNKKSTKEISNVTNVEEINNVINAEERIRMLLQSPEYSQMSDEEKKNACENLLIELKEKGAIENYYYTESNMVYSYEYNGGMLGGIMLKDWEEGVD